MTRCRLALLVLLFGAQARATPPACCSADGQMSATSCGANIEDNLDDSAALALALQCPSPQGTPFVRFPAGHYVIANPIESTLDNQTLTFAEGVLLDFRGAGLTVSGARSRVSGFRGLLGTATVSAFTALTLAGTATVADGVRFEVSADVPSATLLRIAGDQTHVSDVQITGDARSFAYGVQVLGAGGVEVLRPRVDGLTANLDPNDAHREATFGALLYLRAKDATIRDLALWEGGRMLFPDGVIVIDGHVNTLENPNIVAPGAQYGVFRKYAAEFLTLVGGRLDGTGGGAPQRADSEGIRNEQFAGHLKVLATVIVGWDYGVGFHGAHDTPCFFGAPIANNGTAAILIDSHFADPAYGEGDYPITGLTISGAYFEEKAHPNEAFLLLRSGALRGMTLTGSFIAYSSRVIKAETGMGANGAIVLEGNRFAGLTGSSGAVVEPNANSSMWIGDNTLDFINTLATGAYAGKATIAASPGIASLTLGTSDTITGHYRYTWTANFGTIAATTSADLTFPAAQVAPTDSINCTVQGTSLAGNTSLVFTPFVAGWGSIALRAYNTSASAQTGVSGNLFCDVWKH